jgi:hypothetical protein
MHRIVGTLVALALAFGSGCSDSDPAAGGAATKSATVQPRSLPVVWLDILAQRDRIQVATAKGTDMWHEDCSEVSSAAAALDPLVIEFGKSVAVFPVGDLRRTGAELELGYLLSTTSTIRATAVEEQVGKLPALMIGLDAVLQGLESSVGTAELGGVSVLTRPGFNSVRPPPPPSPI